MSKAMCQTDDSGCTNPVLSVKEFFLSSLVELKIHPRSWLYTQSFETASKLFPTQQQIS